jgi:geranylgeranyl diphosphate synthase type I
MHDYSMRGGKRFRAALMIALYNGLTNDFSSKIMMPAVSIELLHAYLLSHDDVMDKSEKRRGKPTIHKIFEKWYLENIGKDNEEAKHFGVSTAILAGDILNAFAMDCITKSDFSDKQKAGLLKIYSDTCRITGDGQVLDMMSQYDEPTVENYMANIYGKTVVYTGYFPVEVACLLGNADTKQKEVLKKFIEPTVRAFQIQDDIIDCFSEKSDKTYGADIKEGKRTLLVVKAFEYANSQQKKVLDSVLGKEDATKEEIEKVKEIIKQTGALDECKKIAKEFVIDGKRHLPGLKIAEGTKKFIEGFADFMINREY